MASPRSVNINDKKKFLKRYNSLSPGMKSNFEYIMNSVLKSLKSCDYGYTDKPDFRFAHKYVFCHIDMLSNPERLQIRLKYWFKDSRTRSEKLQIFSMHEYDEEIKKIIQCHNFYINSLKS